MFKTLKNSWRIPELKNKLLFTLLIIILYRLGSAIPVPYVNVLARDAMADAWGGGNILQFINLLTGGADTWNKVKGYHEIGRASCRERVSNPV